MILYDFSCFIQDHENFITFKKYIYSCFINDFYEFFKIFQDYSRLFKIFHVLIKILNDVLLHSV